MEAAHSVSAISVMFSASICSISLSWTPKLPGRRNMVRNVQVLCQRSEVLCNVLLRQCGLGGRRT